MLPRPIFTGAKALLFGHEAWDTRAMNVPITQAAEGLPRRAFTIADIERMVEIGLIDPDERFELIGGEVVPMSPKGIRHEVLKTWINEELAARLPRSLRFTPETTFRLSADTFLEPDFVVYERAVGLEGLTGASALLVIEVGDTSLAYDRGRKAQLYAAFGIRELWVIDAVQPSTRVHRDPTPTGYRTVIDQPQEAALRPHLIDGFSLSLADFRS
jgi:Uma2 family endonuclease